MVFGKSRGLSRRSSNVFAAVLQQHHHWEKGGWQDDMMTCWLEKLAFFAWSFLYFFGICQIFAEQLVVSNQMFFLPPFGVDSHFNSYIFQVG